MPGWMMKCAHCGQDLPVPQGRGRPRRYCSDACRKKASAIRRMVSATFPVRPASTLADLALGAPTSDVLAEILPTGEPADQLVAILLFFATGTGRLRRISLDLPPQLGGRAERFAREVAESLERNFPGVAL